MESDSENIVPEDLVESENTCNEDLVESETKSDEDLVESETKRDKDLVKSETKRDEDLVESETKRDEPVPSTSNSVQGENKKKSYWEFLEHTGPVFPAPYTCLPRWVSFIYDGKDVKLSQDAEEAAGFYAMNMDRPLAAETRFKENFFNAWRKVMTKEEQELIQDLSKCNFNNIKRHYDLKKPFEKKRKMARDEKIKDTRGFCTVDGKREKIKNYKIEPPGIFYSKGDNPHMGELKRRVRPEDVTINCSKDSKIPEPPEGHRWNKVIHNNTVSWLASWMDNVGKTHKYIELDRTTDIKQNSEREKYSTAKKLHQYIDQIRQNYRDDIAADNEARNQRGVALYFIDKFAFRAGNEKNESQADTAGCCTLKVEHVKLSAGHWVTFDFLGKASVRYENKVIVEDTVYKKLENFIKNKKDGDEIFDKLNTTILNKYLESQMPNLTAKVFRTYNASVLFEKNLERMTPKFQSASAKEQRIEVFRKVNFNVAKLLNHMRTKGDPDAHTLSASNPKKAKSKKVVATRTSLSNYIDPRIAIAWCKKYNIPIEKVYSKKLCDEIKWAKDVDKEFVFCEKHNSEKTDK